MGLKGIIIGLTLSAIIIMAMVNFGIQFGQENGAQDNIADDSRISRFRGNLEGNITDIEPNINTSTGQFFSTPASQGDNQDFFDPLSLRGIARSILSIPTLIFNLTIGLALDIIFGGTSSANWRFVTIFIVLGALLSAIILFYIVRWIRSGEFE